MIQLNRILVPTDFSDHSRAALEYGCAFAERFGAELHLVHVLQDLVGLVPEPGLAFPPPGDYMLELQQSSEQALAALPGPSAPAGLNVERATRQGPPFLEIIRYARETEADLIVMGTHGRSGLAHMLLGSVAEKVVRKAPCPVLTVRPSDLKFAMP
ncbi:MAG TPA: universal stress protein [Planctomycetaceae bacterium]|nr:universal stress protein [Planctomycetaceae bacterium]